MNGGKSVRQREPKAIKEEEEEEEEEDMGKPRQKFN